MGVQVITDNVADLPADVVDRYGLHVVPLKVSFGAESGAERMDPDDFYAKLVKSDPLPTTAAPTPEEYATLYRSILGQGDDAVVVTISQKLSATQSVAERAIEIADAKGRVAVVDSGYATIAEGFVAIRAAIAAQAGATMEGAASAARDAIPNVGFLAAFDTLEYLRRGGRIGAAKALLGSVLRIHPLITIRDGVVAPYGRARSRDQAMDSLVQFVGEHTDVEMIGIEHTACAEDAAKLRRELAGRVPGAEIIESRATPVIGTHTGPDLLVVSLLVKGR